MVKISADFIRAVQAFQPQIYSTTGCVNNVSMRGNGVLRKLWPNMSEKKIQQSYFVKPGKHYMRYAQYSGIYSWYTYETPSNCVAPFLFLQMLKFYVYILDVQFVLSVVFSYITLKLGAYRFLYNKKRIKKNLPQNLSPQSLLMGF